MPGQSEPGSNGNEGVLHIPQGPSITGTSPSDCLVSYPGHSSGGSYPSAEVQSVYFTDPADWATHTWIHRHQKKFGCLGPVGTQVAILFLVVQKICLPSNKAALSLSSLPLFIDALVFTDWLMYCSY